MENVCASKIWSYNNIMIKSGNRVDTSSSIDIYGHDIATEAIKVLLW